MIRDHSHIAIRLTNISKRYTIHHEKPTLVEKLMNGKDEEFWALKDVNLTIRKGERVGIIGPNGSGKTTLLKVIAGITTPTGGSVETHGRIVSLIDLEAGFHLDLTGEQNIYLNGMLLGMKRQEITKQLSKIISFADIKQFIDVPLFMYSTGMKLRLGFAIAVHTNPDILVIDEHFVAGDANFQQKSKTKIENLFRRGKTLLIVSHWLGFIRENCSRALVVKNGTITKDGGKMIVTAYQQSFL